MLDCSEERRAADPEGVRDDARTCLGARGSIDDEVDAIEEAFQSCARVCAADLHACGDGDADCAAPWSLAACRDAHIECIFACSDACNNDDDELPNPNCVALGRRD